MPRLSLYRPNKTADYEFLDKVIYEQFSIGGTDLYVHKYLGPVNPSEDDATADVPQYETRSETNIQDMLFLENRDRKYDSDVYTMRGIYNVSDTDFNLSQFGLFLSNDTLFITIHQNSSVKTLGRKIMSGDVIELPHLVDEYALNDYSVALKRFYVVEDVNRAAEGFSQTWFPHLYRVKCKQMVDSQEFADILDRDAGDEDGNTLRDVLSTFETEMQINNAVVAQAEADAAPDFGAYNAPGKFRFVDVNGDGEINDDDRTEIGSPHPDFTYGINLNLSYKNIALNVFGNGSQGNDLYNYVRYFADFNTFQGNRSVRALREAWQPTNPSAPRSQWIAANPDATSPIMDANDQTSSRTSSYLIEDGSYFRLRNIQLTYTFGNAINDALGISGGNIYIQGQNLLTITNYSGLNPEVSEGNDVTLGYDGGYMPVSKTILVGLNLNLF